MNGMTGIALAVCRISNMLAYAVTQVADRAGNNDKELGQALENWTREWEQKLAKWASGIEGRLNQCISTTEQVQSEIQRVIAESMKQAKLEYATHVDTFKHGVAAEIVECRNGVGMANAECARL